MRAGAFAGAFPVVMVAVFIRVFIQRISQMNTIVVVANDVHARLITLQADQAFAYEPAPFMAEAACLADPE